MNSGDTKSSDAFVRGFKAGQVRLASWVFGPSSPFDFAGDTTMATLFEKLSRLKEISEDKNHVL